MKNKVDKIDQQVFNTQFIGKVEDLQDWGMGKGYMIDAYIKHTHYGCIPYIGFRPMNDEEIKTFENYSAKSASSIITLDKGLKF